MPINFIRRIVYHGLITDARHCLHILLGLSVLLVVIGSAILDVHMDEADPDSVHHQNSLIVLYGDDMYSRLFQGAVGFTIVIALPTVIDIALSLAYLQTWDEFQQPIEFARTSVIVIMFIPNFFIYWQVIPAAVVDLVMFYQYVCLFFILIYRIHTLSISQQKNTIVHAYPLRDLFVNCIFTIIIAFCYKLSMHDLIPGHYIWKGIYTAFLLLLQLITCFKLKPWFQFTWHVSKVVKNHSLLQNKTAFYAVMIGILVCTAMTLVHTATFDHEYVYFPESPPPFIAVEWLFGAALVMWTSVRNFEIRKTELATAVSGFH